jgi:hypothetical protein
MKRRPKNVVVSFLNETFCWWNFLVAEEVLDDERKKERKKPPHLLNKRDDDISEAATMCDKKDKTNLNVQLVLEDFFGLANSRHRAWGHRDR